MNALLTGRWAPTLMSLSVALFALVAPFNHTTPLKRLLLVLGLVGACALVGQSGAVSRFWRSMRGFFLPLLALGVWCLVSTLWADVPRLSAQEWYVDGFLPIAAAFVWATFAWHQDDKSCERVAVLGAVGFTVAVTGGVYLQGIAEPLARREALYEWVHGEGQFSTLVAFASAVMLAWVSDVWRKSPPLKGAGALFGMALLLTVWLAALWISNNRMVWLSNAALALCVLVWQCLAALQARNARALVSALAAPILVLCVSVAGYWWVGATKPVYTSYLAEETPGASSHGEPAGGLPPQLETFKKNERFEIWAFWLKALKEKPLLGHGFGIEVPAKALRPTMPAHWTDGQKAHSHNHLINLYAQLGTVGLGVWGLCMGAWLMRWFGMARLLRRDAAWAWLPLALLSLWLAHITKNLTDDFMSRNPLFIWVAMLAFMDAWAARKILRLDRVSGRSSASFH